MIRRKNPTDEKLLKEIEIEKLIIADASNWEIIYRIRDKNNKILGEAVFDPKSKVVINITIHNLRRKGLATYLYNHIESDQNIIIKPSDYLSDDGKKFWKARLKNPTDLSLLRMIKIVRKEIELGVWNRKRKSEEILIVYKIYFRDNQIGYVEIIKGTNFIEDVVINEEFRRKGLANYLYNYIEKDLKIKLRPSSVQLEDGKAFWKARLNK